MSFFQRGSAEYEFFELGKAFPCFCADRKDHCVRIQGMDILFGIFKIEIKESDRIHFRDQDDVADGKHQRVFQRFVIALRNGKKHDAFVRSGVEFGGTYKISDVFKNEEVHAFHAELLYGAERHIRVDMT